MMTPQQQYAALYEYLQLMIFQKDWHGVRDAVVDIEILIAKYPNIDVHGVV